MKSRFTRLAGLAVALALVLAACGGDDAEQTTTTGGDVVDETTTTGAPSDEPTTAGTGGDVDPNTGLPVIDPFDVIGDIVTAGSSTVFPLSEAVTALFEDEGYGGQITIDSIGSGAGFERFCDAGESDISNASRPIEQEEIDLCAGIGRTVMEFRVGTDALAVVVSSGNYFVENLTLEELAIAFSTAETWADVNPDFPAHPIAVFSPGTDSGTFDYFVEEIFEEDPEPLLAGDPQLSEDDNVLVQGVSGDGCTEGDLATACGIAFFGYAYYTENADVIHPVAIEGVVPSEVTVNDNSYPLSRPLFIYSAEEILSEKPQVADFVAFYLNRVGEVIGDVGYFAAPADAIQVGADAWLAAVGN